MYINFFVIEKKFFVTAIGNSYRYTKEIFFYRLIICLEEQKKLRSCLKCVEFRIWNSSFDYVLLVSKNRNLVVCDCCYKVNYPSNKAKTKEAKNTDDKGNYILCLKILSDTVNCTYEVSKENLHENLYPLG